MNKDIDIFENEQPLPKIESDVLLAIADGGFVNQREMSERIASSIGKVNHAINTLRQMGLLSAENGLTESAKARIARHAPRRAVILAAGNGLRMAPLNNLPKGLLSIHGEPLIERLLRQLDEAGIHEVSIVVGFMKEAYAYLEGRPGIRLVYNADYALKNNLHSLSLVADRLSNCYVVPSDYYCAENPFSPRELYSWYMLSNATAEENGVLLNRKRELVPAPEGERGLSMIGIAYLEGKTAEIVADEVCARAKKASNNPFFWETVLLDDAPVAIYGRVADAARYQEINTFEDLRGLNYDESQMDSEALRIIERTFDVGVDEIRDVALLKKGMTNRSFLFTVRGEKYIMRIPGEGSAQLIDREGEYEAYQAVNGLGLCDDVVFISPGDGYKIARYWDDARVCDPFSPADVANCMRVLRTFHGMRLSVPKEFKLFSQILYYESLWQGTPSVFQDYATTRKNVLSLEPFIESLPRESVLTHIDAVPDNFLFTGGQTRLIDWEYASMCDPHVDVAMFAVYAMYERKEVEALIDAYFCEGCDETTRTKIYCYIAICGLLWSNWCEFKRISGVEFGEYSLRQYLFAKEYYVIAKARIDRMEGETACKE